MKNPSDGGRVPKSFRGGFELSFGVGSHPDEILGLELLDESLDVGLAGLFDGCEGRCGDLVGSQVCAGVLHPDQRAVVGDEVLLEKVFGAAESLGEEAP